MNWLVKLLAVILMSLGSHGLHVSSSRRENYLNHVQLEQETDELAKNIQFGKVGMHL